MNDTETGAFRTRAALYCRVSTADRGQTNDNQLHALRAWADRLGVEVVGEYVDEASGARNDREGLRALLDASLTVRDGLASIRPSVRASLTERSGGLA